MKNSFIMQFGTNDMMRQESFENIVKEIEFSFELLCKKKHDEKDNDCVCFELYYKIMIEPVALIELKRRIDAQMKHDVVELFEYVMW